MSRQQMRAAALLMIRTHHQARRGGVLQIRPWRPGPPVRRPRPWYHRMGAAIRNYWRYVRFLMEG